MWRKSFFFLQNKWHRLKLFWIGFRQLTLTRTCIKPPRFSWFRVIEKHIKLSKNTVYRPQWNCNWDAGITIYLINPSPSNWRKRNRTLTSFHSARCKYWLCNYVKTFNYNPWSSFFVLPRAIKLKSSTTYLFTNNDDSWKVSLYKCANSITIKIFVLPDDIYVVNTFDALKRHIDRERI